MKIIHYLNHGRRANGHVEVAVDLACEQARQDHEVHFVSGPCDFIETLTRCRVTYHLTPEKFGAARPISMSKAFFGVCRSVHPDIVNAHMVASAVAAFIVQPFHRFALVTTIHNSFDRQAVLMRVGNRLIAVSEAVAHEMEAKGIPSKKIRVVRNGTVGGARRPLVPKLVRNLQHPAIATVAGLHPRKGIDDLLNAFEMVWEEEPHTHLYIVGEGPHRVNYEKKAASLKSSQNIHFLGHCDDPREVLGDVDIFVLASHQEPFALVLSEARQMGCAIVATNVGGTPEALWNGQKGKLVPPHDPKTLSTAILSLVQCDSERGVYARAAGTDTGDIMVERMARETLDVYRQLLGSVQA